MAEEFNLNEDAEQTLDSAMGPPAAPDVANVSAPGRSRQSLLRGNLALVVMFAGGLAAVYLLSLREGPAAASAEQRTAELAVDEALSRLGKGDPESSQPQSRAEDVVATFYLQARQRQIPLADLQRNPFRCEVYSTRGTEARSRKEQTPPQDTSQAKALSDAMAEAKGLTLQSILTGSAGATAMISNNLLTEGQKIRGWTVSKIGTRQVVLTWKEHQHVLKMP